MCTNNCEKSSSFFIFITIIITYKALIIGLLIALDIINLTFFTYINYILTTISFLILAIIETKIISKKKKLTKSFRFYTLFIFPVTFGLTAFVSLAILFIIGLNSSFLTKLSESGDGSDLSSIYIKDKIIHSFPFIEIIILLLFKFKSFKLVFTRDIKFNKMLDGQLKFFYWLYFISSPLFILGLYMLTIDFINKYPVPVNNLLLISMVIISSILIQLFLFLLLWPFSAVYKNGNYDEEKIKKKE